MSRFVFDGPLHYPQFYDQEYLERVQKLSFLLGLLERDERSVRKDFVQNIEESKVSCGREVFVEFHARKAYPFFYYVVHSKARNSKHTSRSCGFGS